MQTANKTAGVVCPKCYRDIPGANVAKPQKSRYGDMTRSYLGYCQECDFGFEVQQFATEPNKWIIESYQKYGVSSTPNGDRVQVNKRSHVPPVMTGPGGDFDRPVELESENTASGNFKGFGSRLRKFRKTMGLNQIELAEKLDFSCTNVISRYERMERIPHADILFKLASMFNGLDLHWLVTGKKSAKGDPFETTVMTEASQILKSTAGALDNLVESRKIDNG